MSLIKNLHSGSQEDFETMIDVQPGIRQSKEISASTLCPELTVQHTHSILELYK